MDNRAQSIGLARFLLSLVVAAPLTWILWQVSDRVLPETKNATSNGTANQATVWIQDGVQWFPVALLLIAFFGVIVLAIYQRELLR